MMHKTKKTTQHHRTEKTKLREEKNQKKNLYMWISLIQIKIMREKKIEIDDTKSKNDPKENLLRM